MMDKYHKRYYQKHYHRILLQSRLWTRNARQNYRLKVLEFLGNKCAKCGNSDFRVLQIDHINGNGKQEIKRLGNTRLNLYRYYLENLDYTKSHLQLLCANCNWIKRYENKEFAKRLK